MTLTIKTAKTTQVLMTVFKAVRNFLSAVGMTVAFFALIWVAEKPKVESKLPTLPARYLAEPKKPKKLLKPSALPKAPRIPTPEFRERMAPSKLPTMQP